MVHMADAASAMSDMPKSHDCGACSADAGKALGTCAAMCASIGSAIVATTATIRADAQAHYFLVLDQTGISRAPPPDSRPPKH